MPSLSELKDIKQVRAKGKVPLQLIFDKMNAIISEYELPAVVRYENLITSNGFFGIGKESDPCVVIVSEYCYYSFCISIEFEYSFSYIKISNYGRSDLEYLREIKGGKYLRSSKYIKEWELEQRYYDMIVQAYNEIFT